jgi:hypothetical protein
MALLQRLEAGDPVTRGEAMRILQAIHDDLVPETEAQRIRRERAHAEAKSLPWQDMKGRRSPAEPAAETR